MPDTTQIAVPAAIGALLTFLVPLITRRHWPRAARLAVAVGLTAAVAGATTIAWLRPDDWQQAAAGITAAIALGQIVYQTLKPTGVYTWIGRAPDTGGPAGDGGDKADV